MNNADLPAGSDRAALSALMDGELDASQVAAACASWRSEARQRSDWHLYHLIGDTLRSEDLAAEPARDDQFMRRLRERLEREPVVFAPTRTDVPAAVAPQPAIATAATGTDGGFPAATAWAPAGAPLAAVTPLRPHSRRRTRWAVPVGIAAGVVAVAGVVWSTRPDSAALTAGRFQPTAPAASAATLHDDRATLAEAELSRYLRAHREVPGLVAPTPTAGYLRNAAYDAGER